MRQVGGFVRVRTSVSSTNKTDRHDIAEILLNMALNTITLTLIDVYMIFKNVFFQEHTCEIHFHDEVLMTEAKLYEHLKKEGHADHWEK